MTIKGVLFDMDGVLVDARDWHYDALNRALELFGYRISRDEHLSTFDGLPTRQKLKILSRSRGFPFELHGFLNQLKQKYTIQISHMRCRPTFAHQLALSNLSKDNYKIAVCSNSVRNSIETMMGLTLLAQYIDLILSNEDVEHSKPHPEIYQTAMEHFGLKPDECLILEDNEHGIAAARASGGHVMVVNDPSDVRYEAIMDRIYSINHQNLASG